MSLQRTLGVAGLVLVTAVRATAQDQTIIVDQPLKQCSAPGVPSAAAIDEAGAAALIKSALGRDPDVSTYYIIHATEFTSWSGVPPSRIVVAAERWYVYHAPWQQKPWYWWFRDSRQLKRFAETRILGSTNVGIVYAYMNVPVYESRKSTAAVAAFFLERRAKQEEDDDAAELKALAETPNPPNETERAKLVQKKRAERLNLLQNRLRTALPQEAEAEAEKGLADARAAAASTGKPSPDRDTDLIAWLEVERYFRTFGEQNTTFTSEFPLVNQDTGEPLVGLSNALSTSSAFKSLNDFFYRIEVTKKIPAPVENLKLAASVAFGAQADSGRQLGVKLERTNVCAGANVRIDHIPSDLLVKAMVSSGTDEPAERTKQLFDNEGRYWWDVSFALPADLRRDLTIDVDGGQVAAKSVEKADLFAVINLGMPRDTKRLQWQLVPTFVYGIPITGQPLKHHLVGFTVGLNYVQLLGGWRFDRVQQVSTSVEGNTPVGVESAPATERWERQWVWGINVPVKTIVELLKKDDE